MVQGSGCRVQDLGSEAGVQSPEVAWPCHLDSKSTTGVLALSWPDFVHNRFGQTCSFFQSSRVCTAHAAYQIVGCQSRRLRQSRLAPAVRQSDVAQGISNRSLSPSAPEECYSISPCPSGGQEGGWGVLESEMPNPGLVHSERWLQPRLTLKASMLGGGWGR